MDKTYLHISISPIENCINPSALYTCYKCNACGRIDDRTQKEDAIKMYQRHLDMQYNFSNWNKDPKMRKLQEENIKCNIEYFKEKINEL
jgi:hypothetical protein